MRETLSVWTTILCAMIAVLAGTSTYAADAPSDADKDKPKERPFKYDAWCAFSDLMVDRPYVPPNAPVDPETEHVRPGLDKLGGFGRRGQWAHVVVDLKNTTDPKEKVGFEGFSTIVINHGKLDDMSQTTYMTSYRQSFQVAPQTEKPYHFSVFCPENGWNQQGVTVEISTAGRQFTRDFKLYDLDSQNQQLIVVVSDQPGSFRYLGPRVKNRDEPELGIAPEEATRQIATVVPSELPTRWHDLTLASLIIIDGPPVGGLSPAQWDAIRSYAQAGGKVLIMAGKDPSRLKGAVEELAGIVVRNSTELPELDQFDTKFPASTSKVKDLRVPVIEVTAPGAGIVKRNSKTQIVEYSAKSYGAGIVAFIPFSLNDRMFDGWPERFTIPINLVKSQRNLFNDPIENDDPADVPATYPYGSNYPNKNKFSGVSALRNKLDKSFVVDTPVKKQPPSTVAWFMIIYIGCAVPLNYIIFSLLRRREAAWLAAPFWALAFTIAAYYLSYSGRTGAVTVNQVSVIEAGSGQDTGIGRTFMCVYAPHRDDYQVEFPPVPVGNNESYDTQAAPSHLINTETMEQNNVNDFPEMKIRESGQSLKIEEILIQNSSTRRFEIQHRAWLGGGVEVKFVNANGESDEHPGVTIRNNAQRVSQRVKLTGNPDLRGITFPIPPKDSDDGALAKRKSIEEGIVIFKDDAHAVVATDRGRIDIPRAIIATIQTVPTGRILRAPLFIKNGQYIPYATDDGRSTLEPGQTWDTRNSTVGWRPIDQSFIDTLAAHYRDAGLENKHIADRATAVAEYLKTHLKQYVAGAFIAWTDGTSLPVDVGVAGAKPEEIYLDGITLLVVPATASNRGHAAYQMDSPKVYYATAFSPEVRTSGEWKSCGKEAIPIKTPVDKNQKCVYLRVKFDRDFGQYVYRSKAAQLSFTLSYQGGKNLQTFNGNLELFARLDAAQTPNERFKLFGESTPIVGLNPGGSKKIVAAKIDFTNTELFTGSSVILKVQPEADQGTFLPDSLVLEKVDLQIIDR